VTLAHESRPVIHALAGATLSPTDDLLGIHALVPLNSFRRYEEPCGVKMLGEGFPSEITDDQPEGEGYEVIPFNRRPR